MAKAILELPEMPDSCRKCILSGLDPLVCFGVRLLCCVSKAVCSDEGRRSDCPLKLVDKDILEKQKDKKVVTMSDKHMYGYCPVCGRIYWDKCHVGNYCDQCGQKLEVEP